MGSVRVPAAGKPGCFASLVVLAAGLSTRFGRNKLLEPMGGGTQIQSVVSESLRSKARQVIVVGGHQFEEVSQALEGMPCELVYNEDYEAGQSSSVRKGLSRVAGAAEAVLILPGDMAMMKGSIIDAVIDEYARSRAPVVVAGHEGRGGHPILFARSLFGEMARIGEQTRGLKSVVAAHAAEIVTVEASAAALFDVDGPEDLARLERLRAGT